MNLRPARWRALPVAALLATACSGAPEVGPDAGDASPAPDAASPDASIAFDASPDAASDAALPPEDAGPSGDAATEVEVIVHLDGAPVAGAVVLQGGALQHARTGADGRVTVVLDRELPGDVAVLASHPEARITGAMVDESPHPIILELTRYDRRDNPDYRFADPGEPERRPSTAQCGHCHLTFSDQWFESPHRTAASNPVVHDMYAGAAAAFDSEAACVQAGGRWRVGVAPGSGGAPGSRCYLGDGLLETVNPTCTEAPCEGEATRFGGCADCHAPGIDGQIGGRDLLEASGVAHDYGVHCDVCHRVESVDLAAPAGVAGRLKLMRPSESAPVSLGGGGFRPLTFGPSHDVPNPRMGSVQRDHFRDATLCAGCHQHDAAPMVPGQSADPARWPSGVLPLQSTYAEWLAGPFAGHTPCQECHMPPVGFMLNGGDLQEHTLADVGFQGGWHRPPGTSRAHAWYGPRQPQSRMLELAAALFIERTVAGGILTAEVTVKNVGAGHAIPTGEAMRSLVLSVEAQCGGEPLIATGGDAIPDFGGHLARREAAEGFERWPEAQAGDVVRVVRRPGGFFDYPGFGPFGDGSFSAADKGLPREEVVGERRVLRVIGDEVELDAPLPDGDVAYLARRAPGPAGSAASHLAGAPGFGFARVLADAAGRRMVPTFRAVDVASDNRLMPQASWTSRHHFAATCAAPRVVARLLYRAYPFALAAERGWSLPELPIAEARR